MKFGTHIRPKVLKKSCHGRGGGSIRRQAGVQANTLVTFTM